MLGVSLKKKILRESEDKTQNQTRIQDPENICPQQFSWGRLRQQAGFPRCYLHFSGIAHATTAIIHVWKIMNSSLDDCSAYYQITQVNVHRA